MKKIGTGILVLLTNGINSARLLALLPLLLEAHSVELDSDDCGIMFLLGRPPERKSILGRISLPVPSTVDSALEFVSSKGVHGEAIVCTLFVDFV